MIRSASSGFAPWTPEPPALWPPDFTVTPSSAPSSRGAFALVIRAHHFDWAISPIEFGHGSVRCPASARPRGWTGGAAGRLAVAQSTASTRPSRGSVVGDVVLLPGGHEAAGKGKGWSR